MPTTDAEKAAAAFEPPNWPEGPLKEILVNYVGESRQKEEVTADMVVQAMAEEFPEFLMVVAEENWIRGYHQAIHDVEQGQKLLDEVDADETDATEE